jgi:hypothetical protein
VSCPACRKNGERVAVWVPAARPKTAKQAAVLAVREADNRQGLDHAVAVEGRWSGELPWSGEFRLAPGRDKDMCPKCSGPLSWEPGRTLVFCSPCNLLSLPAAVGRHYEKQERQRSEVAVREHHDPAAARTARVRLRARRDDAETWIGGWIETVADEDSYDRSEWKTQARTLAAMLRGYLPEIRSAESEPELAEIRSEINEWLGGDLGKAIRDEYDQSQRRVEWAEEQNRIRAEQQRLAEEQYAARAIEDKRQADEKQRAKHAAIKREREQEEARQIAAKNQSHSTAALITEFAEDLGRRKDAADARRARNGKCAWCKKTATRLFGFGGYRGEFLANNANIRACTKHHRDADVWIGKQEAYGFTAYHWELDQT